MNRLLNKDQESTPSSAAVQAPNTGPGTERKTHGSPFLKNEITVPFVFIPNLGKRLQMQKLTGSRPLVFSPADSSRERAEPGPHFRPCRQRRICRGRASEWGLSLSRLRAVIHVACTPWQAAGHHSHTSPAGEAKIHRATRCALIPCGLGCCGTSKKPQPGP